MLQQTTLQLQLQGSWFDLLCVSVGVYFPMFFLGLCGFSFVVSGLLVHAVLVAMDWCPIQGVFLNLDLKIVTVLADTIRFTILASQINSIVRIFRTKF